MAFPLLFMKAYPPLTLILPISAACLTTVVEHAISLSVILLYLAGLYRRTRDAVFERVQALFLRFRICGHIILSDNSPFFNFLGFYLNI